MLEEKLINKAERLTFSKEELKYCPHLPPEIYFQLTITESRVKSVKTAPAKFLAS